VNSPSDLARRLSTRGHKLKVDDLSFFARDAGNYRLFSIVNEKGKARPIQWPKRRLQSVHARIHKLLSRVAVPKYLHSAVRGKSYVSNAAAHDPKMPTIKIDVKKFFPSVARVTIFDFFVGPLKCRRDVAGLSDIAARLLCLDEVYQKSAGEAKAFTAARLSACA
jgi:hypothetical protein